MPTDGRDCQERSPARGLAQRQRRCPKAQIDQSTVGIEESVDMPFEFQYLFRFRDLVAPTLEAHRAVLDERGACWWGWWKRPSEPGHTAAWTALQAQAADGPVEVGLFNSGTDTVHRARINQVIVPEQDAFGAWTPVRPPEEDDELIPEYYRSSNGSRAWMRLVDIDADPTPFFGEASFAEPPPLPQYSLTALARLQDKVVLDAAELRAMDTTIWKVRPRAQDDGTERFIAASVGLSSPVSATPVACAGEWVLHLTDPHFAVDPHRGQHRWALEAGEHHPHPTLADAVHQALQNANRSVGAVLVTGDLTYRGDPEEFTVAARELFKLTNGLLGLSLDQVVVVPGNHDVLWTAQAAYDPQLPVAAAPPQATAPYREFFGQLFRYDPSPDLSMARRFVMPGGQLLDIVAVNSSSLEQGQNYLAGMGRIQEQAYTAAANELGWHLNCGRSLRLLALHHHVALTENLETPEEYAKGFGIAIDAPRVLRRAARDGVHLVVHGHKHRVFVWQVRSYELPEHAQDRWDLGSINVLGGGSAGSTDTEGGKNYFQLVRLREDVVDVEMFRSDQGGTFQVFGRWSAKVGIGGVEGPIAPWVKEQ